MVNICKRKEGQLPKDTELVKLTQLDQIILETPRDRSNSKCIVSMFQDALADQSWEEIMNPDNRNWTQYADNNGKKHDEITWNMGTVLKPFQSAWMKTSELLTAAAGETRNEQRVRRLMSC